MQKEFAAHFCGALERQLLRAVLVEVDSGEENPDGAIALIKIAPADKRLRLLGMAAYHRTGHVVVEKHEGAVGVAHRHDIRRCFGTTVGPSPQHLYESRRGSIIAPAGMHILEVGASCMKLACEVAGDMATQNPGYVLETMLPAAQSRVLSLGEPAQVFADPALQAAMGIVQNHAMTAQNARPMPLFDV